MDELTYDPILDSRIVPRVRWFNPLRPPEPGTALVLVPNRGEPLIIHHGEAIPDAHLGTYRHMYLVDIAEHRLVLDVPLLSRDANFAFRSRIGLVCRVFDASEVIARGIRDISAALYDHVKRMLREVSCDYDIADFHEAERALNAHMRTFTGDSAIRLRNIHVELLVDDDELVSSGRAFRDVERETRLGGMRRERHMAMMRTDGVEALLAEIVEREGPRAALEWIASAESADRKELLNALDTVLKHSESEREPFDLIHAERAVLDRLLGNSAAPFGGARSSRLRGHLAPSARDADGRAVEREISAGSPTGDTRGRGPDPVEPARLHERADTAERAAPPDDEPAGDAPNPDPLRPTEPSPDGGSTTPPVGQPRVSRVRGVRPTQPRD